MHPAVLAALLAACTPSPPFVVTSCDTVNVTVAIHPAGLDPANVTASFGSVIEWENADDVAHSVVSDDEAADGSGPLFDSGSLQPGSTFCVEADRAGTYTYSSPEVGTGHLHIDLPSGTGGAGGGGGGGGGGYGY